MPRAKLTRANLLDLNLTCVESSHDENYIGFRRINLAKIGSLYNTGPVHSQLFIDMFVDIEVLLLEE